MREIKISLNLVCQTPPSVGAGGAHGTLADKVVTRDASGRFIIPASQVKGKLRHACEQLLRAQGVMLCRPPQPATMCPNANEIANLPCLLCQIFGSPSDRSTLRFHDLVAERLNWPEDTLRPMVSLNRRRRTAEAQRLFLIETAPYLPDQMQFNNSEAITGYLREERHLHVLLAGLKLLFAWGGGASRGLGWGAIETTAWLDGGEIKFAAKEVEQLCQSSR
jgi:CRISPR/Cas system CSM-associated protein Csm3 (group 7 of RAMP superfamily)